MARLDLVPLRRERDLVLERGVLDRTRLDEDLRQAEHDGAPAPLDQSMHVLERGPDGQLARPDRVRT
jgi:hypothetical protein